MLLSADGGRRMCPVSSSMAADNPITRPVTGLPERYGYLMHRVRLAAPCQISSVDC